MSLDRPLSFRTFRYRGGTSNRGREGDERDELSPEAGKCALLLTLLKDAEVPGHCSSLGKVEQPPDHTST